MTSRSRVSYFYDDRVGSFYYGAGHPMKPHRMRMTHGLLLAYGMFKRMEIYRPHAATRDEMVQFHTDDYIEFLSRVTPDNAKDYLHQLQRFNLGQYTDCPVFADMFDFFKLSAGGSLDGARKLNYGLSDIAINWSGGLHHAKKSESSGFCYVNDIVLAILELLRFHPRVLYIDIDIHHGDGVEEAFYTTDRVMTVSFHKFGDFFPGTGDLKDNGAESGKYYAINFPLANGIDDESYKSVFEPVIGKVMEVYQPTAIVLQCGADSLTGDRLGVFNLTLNGHGNCVKFMKSFGLPLLVLGGGGYSIRNVSRCWAYETSLLLDMQISNNIPYNDFFQYYGPDFKLHLQPAKIDNDNSAEYLQKIKVSVLQQLSYIEHAPSVQMHTRPPSLYLSALDEQDLLDQQDPDVRLSEIERDSLVLPPNEFYSDEKDQIGEAGRRGALQSNGASVAAAMEEEKDDDDQDSSAKAADTDSTRTVAASSVQQQQQQQQSTDMDVE